MSSRELYTWRVVYDDGTLLEEYDLERSDGRGFAEIGEKPVKRIEIEAYNDLITQHSVNIPSGASPVFFRRRRLEINPNDETRNISTAHCIGWKKDDSAVYLFVFEDSSTLLTDDLQAG